MVSGVVFMGHTPSGGTHRSSADKRRFDRFRCSFVRLTGSPWRVRHRARIPVPWASEQLEMPMPTIASIIRVDPNIVSGTPVFVGTRVPVKNLLDYLAAGDSLDRFLDHFPSVTRAQATAALELAGDLLGQHARHR